MSAREEQDAAIAAWRREAEARGIVGDDADELEGHLRDAVEARVAAGASLELALTEAVAALGDTGAVAEELDRARAPGREPVVVGLLAALGALIGSYLGTLLPLVLGATSHALLLTPATTRWCSVAVGIAASLFPLVVLVAWARWTRGALPSLTSPVRRIGWAAAVASIALGVKLAYYPLLHRAYAVLDAAELARMDAVWQGVDAAVRVANPAVLVALVTIAFVGRSRERAAACGSLVGFGLALVPGFALDGGLVAGGRLGVAALPTLVALGTVALMVGVGGALTIASRSLVTRSYGTTTRVFAFVAGAFLFALWTRGSPLARAATDAMPRDAFIAVARAWQAADAAGVVLLAAALCIAALRVRERPPSRVQTS
jgi:hypothetical protein